MCQVPLFQHKEAYLGEVLGCGEHSAHGDASLCGFAAKDLVHGRFEMGFTQAGGGCSQHWRGHFLLLCGSVHN